MNAESDATPQQDRGNAVWVYALLLLIGSLVLLPRLGSYGLWDPWEPSYVQSAREMASDGGYLVPRFLGELDLGQPILALWGILLGSTFVGGELGARIVGVLLALGTILVTFHVVSAASGCAISAAS